MKAFIKIFVIAFALNFTGCWNMYNDVLDDMNPEYKYYLAAVNSNAINTVSNFYIDSARALNPVSQTSIGGPADTNYAASDLYGRYLYVTDAQNHRILMYSITNSCSLVPIGTGYINTENNMTPGAICMHPSGKYLFVSGLSPDNHVYMYNVLGNGSLSYNTSQAIHQTTPPLSCRMAIDQSGTNLYVLNIGAGGPQSSIERFQVTNTLTTTTYYIFWVAGYLPQDLAVHPNGQYVYVATNQTISTINYTLQSVSSYITYALSIHEWL